MGTGSGGKPGSLCHCSLIASLVGSFRVRDAYSLGKKRGWESHGHVPGRESARWDLSFELCKGWKFRSGLGDNLNRIFIKFMLMHQNEINSLNFICPWARLANNTN